MMPQAKIFKCDTENGVGRIYSTLELTSAVKRYNETEGLATFEAYPPKAFQLINMKKVVAKTELFFKDGYVVADIEFLEVPLGKIVSQLFDANAIDLFPVTGGFVNDIGVINNLTIYLLVFPTHKVSTTQTPLQQVKAWIDNDLQPMFKVI